MTTTHTVSNTRTAERVEHVTAALPHVDRACAVVEDPALTHAGAVLREWVSAPGADNARAVTDIGVRAWVYGRRQCDRTRCADGSVRDDLVAHKARGQMAAAAVVEAACDLVSDHADLMYLWSQRAEHCSGLIDKYK